MLMGFKIALHEEFRQFLFFYFTLFHVYILPLKKADLAVSKASCIFFKVLYLSVFISAGADIFQCFNLYLILRGLCSLDPLPPPLCTPMISRLSFANKNLK